jgi:NADH-quinone oxidoreductase subunit M
MGRMGGLWTAMPRLGGVALFFAMASLGLPGLGNFVGEFLVLLGTWQTSVALAAVATGGLVAATIYAVWFMHQVFHGPPREPWKPADLNLREMAIAVVLALALVVLGLYPQPVLDTAGVALGAIEQAAGPLAAAVAGGGP